jgi:hypothetical protein
MTVTASKTQILLARLVVLLVVAFIILDVAWHGVSVTALQRMLQNILDRPGGPLTFRFILQPAMATIAALLDGIKDARTGRSPYLWSVFTNAATRGGHLWEGVICTARIILLGLVMDAIYQVTELGQFYPGEAVIVALTLAFLPYLILRGPIARIARRWRGDAPTGKAR